MSGEVTSKPTTNTVIDEDAIAQIFLEARTYNDFEPTPIPEETLKRLYDITKMGPTSANNSPARFVFVQSEAAKARLKPFLAEGNVDKSMQAPVTVIFAWDEKYYDKIPQLMPHNPGAREWFTGPGAELNGRRNSVLQAGYFLIAARALGLDTGPMTGFDAAGVDAEFFAGNPATENWKSDILINLGVGTTKNLFPRLPRLSFDEAAQII
ncbi:malonic semialdehyde reductase [Maricaulis sp.]|uniref:malonic semialdehyde reductase n=1 Tax=Maricaulis sp. TaxID=1486257 RepID=UPI003A8E7C72